MLLSRYSLLLFTYLYPSFEDVRIVINTILKLLSKRGVVRSKGSFKLLFFSLKGSRSNVLLRVSHKLYPHPACDTWIYY